MQATAVLLRCEEDFAEVLEEYLERAENEGVKYAEVMVDVQNHMSNGIKFE